MRSMPVVLVDPGHEVAFSLCGVLISACIGPFVDCSLDEAFGFTVGAWGVGACASMLDADFMASIGEGMGAIAHSVVSQYSFAVDAIALVKVQCDMQEVQH